MNKSGKPFTRLTLLGAIPAIGDLQNLAQYVRHHPGEQAEVAWTFGENLYLLRVRLALSESKNTGRKGTVCYEIEWTLLSRQAASHLPEKIWSHICSDCEFILGLLAALPASPTSRAVEADSRSGRARVTLDKLKVREAAAKDPRSMPEISGAAAGSSASEVQVLRDYQRHLYENGMNLQSVLVRTRKDISYEEFYKIITGGLPVDLQMQEKFYLEIDNKSTLQDIIARLELGQTRWISIAFNLHNCGLIGCAGAGQISDVRTDDKPPIPGELSLARAKSFLFRLESGLMSYELFYHFLKLEFMRFERTPSYYFSVIVFSIFNAQSRQPISVSALNKLAAQLEKLKDELDIVAHYRERDFIMLCPASDVTQAASLTEHINSSLKQFCLDGIPMGKFRLGFGIAGVPDNCSTLPSLLCLAEAARNAALDGKRLLVISNDRMN